MKLTYHLLVGLLCISASAFSQQFKQTKTSTKHLPNTDVFDVKGHHGRLSELGKGKVTIIDSWFIPCPPCFSEMGLLNDMYDKYKSLSDIRFITLCATDSGIFKLFVAKDKRIIQHYKSYENLSGRKDFQLPVYFIPGCNTKIGLDGYHELKNYKPDNPRHCPDAILDFKGYPTLMIFDKKGKLIFCKTGYDSSYKAAYRTYLEKIIKAAIAK